MPLTILFGCGLGVLVLDGLTLLETAILATMLAPTDAALGEAAVTDEAVPRRMRESLNVESGLNDGICVLMKSCSWGGSALAGWPVSYLP